MKFTLTVTDEVDGAVTVRVDFDPPVTDETLPPSTAQAIAQDVLDLIADEYGDGESLVDVEG